MRLLATIPSMLSLGATLYVLELEAEGVGLLKPTALLGPGMSVMVGFYQTSCLSRRPQGQPQSPIAIAQKAHVLRALASFFP
jgi:hypothetical protein